MEHLLFKVFSGIYFLILSSAEEPSNCNRVTHEDLITHINAKFEKMERKVDSLTAKIENIENGIQSTQCESSLDEVMINSTGGSWRVFNDACIRDNEYMQLSNMSIESCKQRCREEGGRVCRSITYHPSTNTCHLSGLGSKSDGYSQPCYLHGYDLYEYTERRCPKGYFKPQGSNQCYIGCPDGFFMLPAPSYQCLKFFNGSTLGWDAANTKCLEEGLVMARPHDGLTARQYIAEKYGAEGVETRAWLGARGTGKRITWLSGGEAISPNNPLLWPNHGSGKHSSINHCMQLLSNDWHRKKHPGKPYAMHSPCTDNTKHNALCELVQE